MWCPNLTLDGRCGDYENRPYACMHYKPGTDPLCIMHGLIEQPTYGDGAG
jgi:Fe-S-cluster containining protein